MRALIVLLFIFLAAIPVVGCGDETSEEATAQLKSDLQALQTSVASLEGLSADSSMDDITAAKEDIQKSWDAVRESAGDLHEAEVSELQSAWDDLSKAVDDINQDMSVPDAIASVSDEVAAVKAAWDKLNTTVNEQ